MLLAWIGHAGPASLSTRTSAAATISLLWQTKYPAPSLSADYVRSMEKGTTLNTKSQREKGRGGTSFFVIYKISSDTFILSNLLFALVFFYCVNFSCLYYSIALLYFEMFVLNLIFFIRIFTNHTSHALRRWAYIKIFFSQRQAEVVLLILINNILILKERTRLIPKCSQKYKLNVFLGL